MILEALPTGRVLALVAGATVSAVVWTWATLSELFGGGSSSELILVGVTSASAVIGLVWRAVRLVQRAAQIADDRLRGVVSDQRADLERQRAEITELRRALELERQQVEQLRYELRRRDGR